MFIQTEATPNPATLKFLPGKSVLGGRGREFTSPEEARVSPLARRLFGISGITGVFFGHDFIAVTKSEGEWVHLKPLILGQIMEHYLSGLPLIDDEGAQISSKEEAETASVFFDPKDSAIVETIKELLETRVRPAVAQDGGDIAFRGYKDGVVYLSMHGACSGCPSSTATLQYGVQNLLCHFIPEVQEVRAVE